MTSHLVATPSFYARERAGQTASATRCFGFAHSGTWIPLAESCPGAKGLMSRTGVPSNASIFSTSTTLSLIVAAYDGSPQADRALQSFQALGLPGGEEVHVVSVRANQANARRVAEQAVDFLRLHGVNATPLPIASTMSVDRIIIAEVQKVHPDLLVTGAYGRSMWKEFIFGSITTRVLEASPVPLFLCH